MFIVNKLHIKNRVHAVENAHGVLTKETVPASWLLLLPNRSVLAFEFYLRFLGVSWWDPKGLAWIWVFLVIQIGNIHVVGTCILDFPTLIRGIC